MGGDEKEKGQELAITFSKQSEFQLFIDSIQRDYVSKMKWRPEWSEAKRPHILKSEYEHLNLQKTTMHAIQDWEERHHSHFPWHYSGEIRSSRNLHSSQVFGLTLFGALILNNRHFLKQALVSTVLSKPGEEIQEYDFEYEPPNFFNEPRRTSVDFMVKVGRNGEVAQTIYFEVKFLESTFGPCSRKSHHICSGFPQFPLREIPSQCLLMKDGIRYWEFLPEIMAFDSSQLGCPIGGYYYQLVRNVIHLIKERGRAFVILSDNRTKYLDDQIKQFINHAAPKYQTLIRTIDVQQLVPYIYQADISAAELLAEKYGII